MDTGSQILRPGFERPQLLQLRRLFEFARELTGDHYHLGAEDARRMPVEIRTLVDLEDFEIQAGDVLAYIARLGYNDSRFGRRRDLYQVNLLDHNILGKLKHSEDLNFSALLLYVLTHELVHVIRFLKFMTPFYQSDSDHDQEEGRVHGLTQSILRRVPVSGMSSVLEKYRHLAG